MITEEDLWYFKTTGFYKVRETLSQPAPTAETKRQLLRQRQLLPRSANPHASRRRTAL